MELNRARILLTGASGGLGAALARELAARGAALLLTGRDPERLEAAARAAGGRETRTLAADLGGAQGIADLAEAACRFEANVLINNAGVMAFGLFEDQDWARAADVLETNLLAPLRLTHALLPWLKGRDEAAVVNVGSTFGSLPFPGFAAYSAAKAGLRGFSQALRRELADSPVRVIHIAPRAIATPLNPPRVEALNRALGSRSDPPEAVARQIADTLAAGHPERHIGFPERLFAWLNGSAPGLIDRALASKLAVVKHHATR
ncbi:MAG: SDR family oxidoreductase [Betaproteobacteria bacterium]|nr:SDR family oxidoreductase [Betaproteobacteria bacterium]